MSVAWGRELLMIKQLSKKDLEKVSKEALIALFVVFARRAEENHCILCRISGLRTQIKSK